MKTVFARLYLSYYNSFLEKRENSALYSKQTVVLFAIILVEHSNLKGVHRGYDYFLCHSHYIAYHFPF